MRRAVHALAGAVAQLMISLFFSATVIAELALSADAVAVVKSAIVTSLFVPPMR